jgi:hypothetical protein
MKSFILALSVVATLGLSACAGGGDWTPMSGGRTAGEGMVKNHSGADGSFSRSMHK